MAAKLCCTTAHRSLSPDTPNARLLSAITPIKTPSKSGAPCARSGRLDEAELNRIFVAASLPEDHPHAIRLPGRKPRLETRILRSPSFGNKLKRQLSRKSLVSSRSLASLRPHGPRLAHHRSKHLIGTGDLTLAEILFDRRADEGGYDPDARSVNVASRLGISEAIEEPMEPPQQLPPIDRPSFDWLMPYLDK